MNKKELLKVAMTLGITEVNEDSTVVEIQKAINVKLGNPEAVEGEDEAAQMERTNTVARAIADGGTVASKTGAVVSASGNIPNLTPNGIWEGKRARIRRNSTGHNDMNGAIFRWNGWPTIVPIDEEVDVAWPIYEIIKACKGLRMEISNEIDPRNQSRVITTKTPQHYDKYPYSFICVTPGTEHLPESALEYTLDAYVDDFEGFSVRNWRQMCVMWELSNDYCKVVPGMNPDEEIHARYNAIHSRLNLQQGVDRAKRLQVRDQIRLGVGMQAKAA